MRRTEFARRLGADTIPVGPAGGGPVVVAEREPARFQRAFAAAVASGADVFLADPGWGAAERAELARIPKQVTQSPPSPAGGPRAEPAPDECSDRSIDLASAIARGGAATPGPPGGRALAEPDECSDRSIHLASTGERGWLMIPSGGTGGRLKFARHDQATIAAAVRGFCAHFQIARVNAVGVLPLHHVSGFMAWMRCALTGGEYVAWDWKQLEYGITPAAFADGDGVISLVPTQLQRLLATPATVEWLRGFRAIFVGGGPAWSALLDAAAAARLRISPSYGMTETAAMVAALHPDEFLAGDRSAGTALPHAEIAITGDGVIRAGGESIFRGYFPDWREARAFETEDLGTIDAAGHLTILGRRDAMIITGGKKVNPAEVEQALRTSGEFSDVAVIGIPDADWGEMVVACYPAAAGSPNFTQAAAALAAHQRPKRFVAINDWPRNEQGKVNREVLRQYCTAGPATSGAPKPIRPEPPHGAGGDWPDPCS